MFKMHFSFFSLDIKPISAPAEKFMHNLPLLKKYSGMKRVIITTNYFFNFVLLIFHKGTWHFSPREEESNEIFLSGNWT